MRTRPKSPYRIVHGQRIELVLTVDGAYMVCVNGFQWGGNYDADGSGDAVFKTVELALATYRQAMRKERREWVR